MSETRFPAMEPEVRCKAGTTEFPPTCNRHQNHYWCVWCAGYYGVPHDGGGCHMSDLKLFPRSNDCACRFCGIAQACGFDAALRERNNRHGITDSADA